ncbi:MAG: TatD family hydrolase [Alphaproteobacteria bacterium]|nr:TatD family hydrolase [Alphaproteobacteria bacterium]
MLIRLFDVHIHLTDFLGTNPQKLIAELKANGIEKCVCVTAKPQDWEKAARFAHDFPFEIIPSFGLHPWYAAKVQKGWEKELELYLKEFNGAIIGECGLDKLKSTDISKETEVFEKQIELAFVYNRSLMLHMVKADMWLEKYWGRLPEKSVFHSFSGSVEILKKIINFNYYLSVNKRFFSKKDAGKILEYAPMDRLLVETDAPFQSEIKDLKTVVQNIAEIKNESVEDLAHQIYLNAMDVFVRD